MNPVQIYFREKTYYQPYPLVLKQNLPHSVSADLAGFALSAAESSAAFRKGNFVAVDNTLDGRESVENPGNEHERHRIMFGCSPFGDICGWGWYPYPPYPYCDCG